MISGHSDAVNAVRFLHHDHGPGLSKFIVSGSSDRSIRVNGFDGVTSELLHVLHGHQAPVRCVATLGARHRIISGSADSTIKIWHVSLKTCSSAGQLLQTLETNPTIIPLSIAVHYDDAAKLSILAVAGTHPAVFVYSSPDAGDLPGYSFQAKLSGHEDWIRALAFAALKCDNGQEIFLASAGHDKRIRLWKFESDKYQNIAEANANLVSKFATSLSVRRHVIRSHDKQYVIQLEALIQGHEDWIYSLAWKKHENSLQLLSASADNSISIWEKEAVSGLWLSTVRHGELSTQKGATTATGSAGGFWIGMWSPTGLAFTCLDKSGSWRLWIFDPLSKQWSQSVGTGGHTQDLTDIAWSPNGDSIYTCSLDQTTRMFANWEYRGGSSWHEIARPQIHGYDIQCIAAINAESFVSGSDEKLLRVFKKPEKCGNLVGILAGRSQPMFEQRFSGSGIPVLGLSNTAQSEERLTQQEEAQENTPKTPYLMDRPPNADVLASQTLWPEEEKLYGHGYEIAAVAVSHDGAVIASSCKASSLQHAVIRTYSTNDWRECGAPIAIHELTCTGLTFSEDDRFLLSVGRDRIWAISERSSNNKLHYHLQDMNRKGHNRMILSATWAPLHLGYAFATAGRDKSCKIWKFNESGWCCTLEFSNKKLITAISFAPSHGEIGMLSIGYEDGQLCLTQISRSLEKIGDTTDLTQG